MPENKTKLTENSVDEFIESIAHEKKKEDSKKILTLMKRLTGEEPKMWGTSIIGFGNYHYKYANGHEGDWFITGFSPRKQNISLYLTYGIEELKPILNRLGKYKTGKACLYINKLEDVDMKVLEELIVESIKKMKEIAGKQI